MSKTSTVIAVLSMAAAGAGCTTTKTPIVAGAVDNVGVTAGMGAQSQGANLTVGYKGAKFAVVPVQNEFGERLTLKDGAGFERGFSVFALLGVDAKGGVAPGADIRQVVAVGPAADLWAFGASGVTPNDVKAARDFGLLPGR